MIGNKSTNYIFPQFTVGLGNISILCGYCDTRLEIASDFGYRKKCFFLDLKDALQYSDVILPQCSSCIFLHLPLYPHHHQQHQQSTLQHHCSIRMDVFGELDGDVWFSPDDPSGLVYRPSEQKLRRVSEVRFALTNWHQQHSPLELASLQQHTIVCVSQHTILSVQIIINQLKPE